eukprot:11207336-Lingulodinium_polyedra.AAC.1
MSGARKLGQRRAAAASGNTLTAGPSGASPSCFGAARDSSTPCPASLAAPTSTTAASRTTSTYCA